MLTLLRSWKGSLLLILIAYSSFAQKSLKVDTVKVLSKKKLDLTVQYNKENYGFSSYRLDTPRIIVVHYTAIDRLDATLNLFKKDNIASSRDYIKDFSSLNVGIHYVVDKDGHIYSLHPDTVVARHLIGFNHVSLGIENIAADSTGLTKAQIESNAKLIGYLAKKYPTIKYMIGHHEYNNKKLPHYKYFRSLNPAYKPYGKIDPGDAYMRKLRNRLAADGVVLEK
ncbi:MAG TPA: peptidoglycan recognition family protein [Cyclobacteriaceae bacterium]|nr:peptidoglycan recognition family protein [Cyclobacteriaceae bacterium]